MQLPSHLAERDPFLERATFPSGCSAAWLAHLLGVQEVAGSNPVSPTTGEIKIPLLVVKATGNGI